MRYSIRMICAAAVCMICFMLWMFPCRAADTGDIYRAIAPAELDLPQDAQQALEDAGITPDEPESILNLSPADVLRQMTDALRQEASAPVKLLGSLLALTLLSGLLTAAGDTVAEDSMKRMTEMLCTLICTGAAARPLCTCLLRTADALRDGQQFMIGYVPAFAGFLAAGGSVANGASYQIFVLFLTELLAFLTRGILFPLLQMSAAAGIVDAVGPSMKLGGFVSGSRKAVTWLLGTVMTLFSALLSVRSFVAAAADSLGAKTVKLLSAGLIPIVGGAVSDAYSTVQGSIRLLRNGMGAVGILAVIWIILPPLLSLLCYRLVFAAGGICAEMSGAEAVSRLMRNTQAVLDAAFAMLFTAGLMLILSTAIMLLLTGNAAV